MAERSALRATSLARLLTSFRLVWTRCSNGRAHRCYTFRDSQLSSLQHLCPRCLELVHRCHGRHSRAGTPHNLGLCSGCSGRWHPMGLPSWNRPAQHPPHYFCAGSRLYHGNAPCSTRRRYSGSFLGVPKDLVGTYHVPLSVDGTVVLTLYLLIGGILAC